MGRFMGRDYVTLKSEDVGGETLWMETWVSRIRLKSAVARLDEKRRHLQGSRLRAHRRHAAEGGRGERGRRRLEAGDDVEREHGVFVEAVHLRMERARSPANTRSCRARSTRVETCSREQDHPTKRSQWENNGQFIRKFTL